MFWISEVMVNSWADKADSIEEVLNLRKNIRESLEKKNPDVLFLDDDNLNGFCGKILLEEIYRWYTEKPGCGFVITSNNPIVFEECYGFQLDETYNTPPFLGYNSDSYNNITKQVGLDGINFRKKDEKDLQNLTESEKISLIMDYKSEKSLGIIVLPGGYDITKNKLNSIEYVPGFTDETLVSIRASLRKNGMLGDEYEKLTPVEKKWLEELRDIPEYKIIRIESFQSTQNKIIRIKPFQSTEKNIIAIEIHEGKEINGDKIIASSSLSQLLRVLHYAHDTGGKKVIIINKTSFSNEELFSQIKNQIPENGKERTISRLEALFPFESDAILPVETKVEDTKNIKREETKTFINNHLPPDILSLLRRRYLSDSPLEPPMKNGVNKNLEKNQQTNEKKDKNSVSKEVSELYREQNFFKEMEKQSIINRRYENLSYQKIYDQHFGLTVINNL